ncbi:MAG: methyltransferase domain-containing protein [Deltaproteobacteria bacterium]|nr:methyltransferase domain-containing protein [Deltaproteobacteria bacterium]
MKHDHHKSRFHDHQHAVEFDQRAAKSEIRVQLGEKLVEALNLSGAECVLDLATGTGRFAHPVSRHLESGRIVGLDEALAMLRVGQEQTEPIRSYFQAAGNAEQIPFKSDVFDRAFVCFSLHHFGAPLLVAKEILRVLKLGGIFAVVDPILKEARDTVDEALNERVNQVFRRTHGENFRFQTGTSIRDLLSEAGFRIARFDLPTFAFDQEGMEGIPTGRHWLEAAEGLADGPPELAERFGQNYLRWEKKGQTVRVFGSFPYALICGEKPG